jgi:radical SAM superfamily enzyme YgiQ (UPF0313 family)/SAM-dependent methyltransferase/predicted SAM-dependent methyltransferase
MDEHEIQAITACLKLFSEPVDVLEWRSGDSTTFFSGIVHPESSWLSIEHDRQWVQNVRQQIAAAPTCRVIVQFVAQNAPLKNLLDDGDATSFADYCAFPALRNKPFDVIFVDGRARVECMRRGWPLLKNDGVMILHDANRREYLPGVPADGYCVRMINPAVNKGEGPIGVLFVAKSPERMRLIQTTLRALLPATIRIEAKGKKSSPGIVSPADDPGRSCFFINTYYPVFLRAHYRAHPGLEAASFQEQLDSLQSTFFGDSDFYSRSLRACGWDAWDAIVNCDPLQAAWAREQGVPGEGPGLVVEQIRRTKPAVVYLQDLSMAAPEFLSAIRPLTELIVGQIASPVPPQASLNGLDIIISSLPHFAERFRARGITSYYQPLAFEPRVLDSLGEMERDIKISFVGGISPSHSQGLALLEYLARRTPITFHGYGADQLPQDSAIAPKHGGEAWGRRMFSLLRRSQITVNRHIDIAENNANNMRLFEATGCGALLITDYKDNLSDLFEIGKEVVAYRSPEECLALINYYGAHPDEAAAIARAGQERTLRDHRYSQRMAYTAEVLSRHLRYRKERPVYEKIDTSAVSSDYRSIDAAEVTPAMQKAWQSAGIPVIQRALVQRQLERMYHGDIEPIFQVLADALKPFVRNGSTVLEIGCASGYYGEILDYLLPREFSYFGLDYSLPLIALARDYYPTAKISVADGGDLPCKDSSYDVVISSCILLHVTDYRRHIKETARVARDVVIAHRTPVCRDQATRYLTKRAYGEETVELVFNENELLSIFAENGLSLLTKNEYGTSPSTDRFEVTYVFRKHDHTVRALTKKTATEHPQNPAVVEKLTWDIVARIPSIKFYAGDIPDQPEYAGLIGLSIAGNDTRHLYHDLRLPIPLPDNTVDSFQSEDVFEHIDRENMPAIVEEIYRVLKPGCLFRLSVPDYRCDLLRDRSDKDSTGRIVFDPAGEGTRENPGHRWFPTIESVSAILDNSSFARNGTVDYLHYYRTDGSFVLKPIDYTKGHIDRTPDFDARVQSPRRPMSLVVDLVKGQSKASSAAASIVHDRTAQSAPAGKARSVNPVCRFRTGPVVLVSRDIAFTFPLSYAYLAGYLRSKGEEVVVLFKDCDRQTLVNRIMSLNPVLVGLGNLYPELRETAEIIAMLDRSGRQFSVVIGGQMVSPLPEFAVQISGADFGVIGEGEIILHRLVIALREGTDVTSVKGLAVRNGSEIVLTGPGEFIEDLNMLPPVPYDLFPTERWLPIGEWYAKNCPQPHWHIEDRVINVHGGRGCPFRCNFCYHHSKPRYRSLPVMFAEAAEALDRFDGNMLYFSDDLVLSSPARAQKLVEQIRGLKRRINFSVSTRFDLLARMDDQLLGEMKDAGCRIMGLGIESGSDRILKIIGKNCTAATILEQLARLKRFGILPTVSIMVGQHTETLEDAEASLALMKESVRNNPLIQYAFSIMTPFPGSPLYDLIFSSGLLKNDREFYDRYFSSTGEWKQVVNLSAMKPEQVIAMHAKLEREYSQMRQGAILQS